MVKSILVVDDEEDFALFVKEIVEDLGFECFVVSDGKSALLKLQHFNFDLILLDILMPNMSGVEVLKKIRLNSKLKNQRVAFLSVLQLSFESKNNIFKLKPIAFFQKPIVDLYDFKSKLKKILA